MQITNKNLDLFRDDALAALKSLEKKYGVKIETGNITYSLNNFSLSIKVANLDENGIDKDTNYALNNFEWFSNIYQKTFKNGRSYYKVVGYDANSIYCIKCLRQDGKNYSFKKSILENVDFTFD